MAETELVMVNMSETELVMMNMSGTELMTLWTEENLSVSYCGEILDLNMVQVIHKCIDNCEN